MNRGLMCIGMGMVLCAVGLVGCGDDDDTADDSNAGTGGAGTGGVGSGGAGSGGTGAGGAGGMTGMTAQPIQCGANTCRPPAGLAGLLGPLLGGGAALPIPTPVACCLPADACGMAAMMGAACETRATPDTRCPSVTGLMPVAGCCTEAGQCGVDGMLFGRGCVENTEAKAMLAAIPGVGGFITIPAAQACGAISDDGGMTEDAGP